MKKKILIVDVPDNSKIIGCDVWIEQFCETYRKQIHITDYTEFTPPSDDEIATDAITSGANASVKSGIIIGMKRMLQILGL